MSYLFVALFAIVLQVVLNFISQKIHCSYDVRYQISAVLSTVVAISLTFRHIGYHPAFYILAIAEAILVTSSVVDIKYQIIPDSYMLAVALLGMAFVVLYRTYFAELLAGSAIAFILFLIIALISGRMGGGDVKMAGAVGLFIGTWLIGKFIVYTFLGGAAVALLLLLLGKKRDTLFSFGPFIALSAIYLFAFRV